MGFIPLLIRDLRCVVRPIAVSAMMIKNFPISAKKVQIDGEINPIVGKCFYIYAGRSLSLVVEAKEAVSNTTTINGTVTIGAPESICATRLPIVLQEYGRRYPQVKIVLKIGAYNDFLYWLKNNSIDMALLFQRELDYPNLVAITLLDEPIVAVAGSNNHICEKGRLEPIDLREETVISL